MLCLSLWTSDVPQVDTLVGAALAVASAVTLALASELQLIAGADLLVHNTGGLSLTAALVTGVPSLTLAPMYGHRRATARTLDRAGTVRWTRTAPDLTRLAPSTATRGSSRSPSRTRPR